MITQSTVQLKNSKSLLKNPETKKKASENLKLKSKSPNPIQVYKSPLKVGQESSIKKENMQKT